jgi:orotate phosphoribosyltransferase
MESLTRALARAGLVQFGRFARSSGETWPVMVNLLWLPSYPALLRDVAAALHPLLHGIEADRLLTTADALPIGVALSLRADLPLVYPYGEVRDYTAAFAIEGAYDVGHPTLLLSDALIDAPQANAITALARKVGLDVHSVLAVVDLGLGAREALESAGYAVRCVVALRAMLAVLLDEGLLPPIMHATVETWMEGYRHAR